jgi:hypothetical protein
MSKVIIALVIAVALAGAFLGFTKPGHQMLYNLGLTSACGTDGGCSN